MAKKQKSFDAELDALLAGVELPSDEQLRKETGAQKRVNDPEWRAAFKKGHSASRKVMKESGYWATIMEDVNKRIKNDPVIRAARVARNKEMAKDPTWIANNKKVGELKKKPLCTPMGIFDSLTSAMIAHEKKSLQSMWWYVKNKPTEYYYITLEEYNATKNKNVKK
jgi:hypothetical protein